MDIFLTVKTILKKENQNYEDDYSAELGQLKYKKENDKDFKEEK